MTIRRQWALYEVAETTMPSTRCELDRDQAALLETHEAYCWRRYGLAPREAQDRHQDTYQAGQPGASATKRAAS
jgi:hypothetical protein